jgi:hypothetical protein
MTTVAFSSSELATRGINTLRAKASTVCGAWRSLVSTSRKPPGHPPLDVKPVRATVKRNPRFVYAGLRGQQPDRLGGYVGCVGDQDVDAAPQRSGQRLVEVAFVDLTTGSGEVAAGAPHRSRVDVDGVQLDPVQGRDQRCAHRARAAAQVNDDSSWPGEGLAGAGSLAGQGGGLVDEELGAAAGYEDSGVHGYPQAAELRPAEDVFERQASGSPVHHGGEVDPRPCRGDEQLRLILGEDTAGGPKPGDDDGSRVRRQGDRQGSLSGCQRALPQSPMSGRPHGCEVGTPSLN